MILGLRRLLAALAIGMALLIGAPAVFAAAAPTPSPTPSATAKSTAKSSASPSSEVDTSDDEVDSSTDTAPDNSRTLWLLGGAGVVAVCAAAIVIARR